MRQTAPFANPRSLLTFFLHSRTKIFNLITLRPLSCCTDNRSQAWGSDVVEQVPAVLLCHLSRKTLAALSKLIAGLIVRELRKPAPPALVRGEGKIQNFSSWRKFQKRGTKRTREAHQGACRRQGPPLNGWESRLRRCLGNGVRRMIENGRSKLDSRVWRVTFSS